MPSPDDRRSEFSAEERTQLLRLAHESILSALEAREIPLDPPSPHLTEPRGAFTTLYLHDRLRGCVGYVLPISSVYRAVADTARAAAFEDNRFHPVTLDEAPHLKIELSIFPCPTHQPGTHRNRTPRPSDQHAWLSRPPAPQVPVEHHWDRETFLDQTCRKAGLPPDAWRKGALIEAFTGGSVWRKVPGPSQPRSLILSTD